MSFIDISNLSFRYSPESRDVLKGINLKIEQGSYTAILGHNGSGKSTLAKLICGLIQPTAGTVVVDGYNTADENSLYRLREKCGMIFQNPDNQLVASIVEEDVAFAPENLGVPREEIRRRVDESLAAVRMTDYAQHITSKLSGGQKQRIAIAGVLAMAPDCIIFDEATAMIDPLGRKELIDTMKRLNQEKGITIVTITHYMNEAVEADRVVVLNKGEIFMDDTPVHVFSEVEKLQSVSLSVPQVTELLYSLNRNGFAFPKGLLHTNEASAAILNYADRFSPRPFLSQPASAEETPKEAPPILSLQNISYIYGEKTSLRKVAVNHISVDFPKGQVIGIVGHTGSGKSTLASMLIGLMKPSEGTIFLDGKDIWENPKQMRQIRSRIGLVFQYPEYQLFEETVHDDIAFGPKNMGISGDALEQRIQDAAAFCGLSEEELQKSPFELSGGQKRRAAIAGIIAMEPEVLVLDEPAAGLDPKGRREIFDGLMNYRQRTNATLLLISHSMEEIANYADRILVLKEGSVHLYGTVKEVFAEAEKLADASLDFPQVTKLFVDLKKAGLVNFTDVYTLRYAKKMLEVLLNA